MSNFKLSDLWTWSGTVERGTYAVIGVVFFVVKHNVDRFAATWFFGKPWGLFNYWLFDDKLLRGQIPPGELKFYVGMVALSLPFVWVGVSLTLKRLRSLAWPPWMVLFFFIPFVNLLFFILLAVLPGQEEQPAWRQTIATRRDSLLQRIIPESGVGSAALGVLVTVPLCLAGTLFSVKVLGDYGWGLFVGLPFMLGLTSVWLYGFHQPRSLGMCLVIALLAMGLVTAALIAFAIEGVICLVMAAPLGLVVALFGGLVGYFIQRRPTAAPEQAFQAYGALLLALPLLMFAETATQTAPPLYEVKTVVDINAPPEKVWANLVAFAELPPPQETLLQTGIAYPIRAEIHGRGVGAVRHCVFSTGPFVEPITVWDEPRLLRFSVESQPPIMREMSPYQSLRPPHLENYLHSRQGQFLLTPLPNGGTRLEGTTWYENRFWPAAYWHLWSDAIIHRIHGRVLNHIKQLAEK